MNKLLIFSDTHTIKDFNNLLDENKNTLIIHCGDSQLPYNHELMSKINVKVKGNCDFDINYKEEEIFYIENKKFLVLHGHTKGVKFSTHKLKEYCKAKKIDFCFYGHTHILDVEYLYDNRILLLNPGSYAKSRSKYSETYVELIYDNKQIKIIIKDAKTKEEIENKKIKIL